MSHIPRGGPPTSDPGPDWLMIFFVVFVLIIILLWL